MASGAARMGSGGEMTGAAAVSAIVVFGHGKPPRHGDTKTSGMAAENRLGVGLGGDRRV